MTTLSATLSVTLIGSGLIVLGVVIIAVTVSFWRGSTEDPEVLAPLEVMAGRRFARADDLARTEMLAGVRPDDVDAGTRYVPAAALREADAMAAAPGDRADDTDIFVSVDPLISGGDPNENAE